MDRCGSGSRRHFFIRIRADPDPDPKHCLWLKKFEEKIIFIFRFLKVNIFLQFRIFRQPRQDDAVGAATLPVGPTVKN